MAGTDLVELTTLDPTILLDVRYARELRFVHRHDGVAAGSENWFQMW